MPSRPEGPVPGDSGPRTKLARTHSEDGMTKADGKQPARLMRLFPVAHARSFGGIQSVRSGEKTPVGRCAACLRKV